MRASTIMQPLPSGSTNIKPCNNRYPRMLRTMSLAARSLIGITRKDVVDNFDVNAAETEGDQKGQRADPG
jgi:hypothetical protein